MNADAARYGLAKSRRAVSEVYLRTPASICGWTYSLCLRVNSRPFAVKSSCSRLFAGVLQHAGLRRNMPKRQN